MKNQNEDGTWDLSTELDQESHEQLRAFWNVSALRRNAENMGIPQGEALNAEMWSYEEYKDRIANAQSAAESEDGGDGQEADPNAGTGSVPVPASIGAQQAAGLGLGATGQGAGATATDPTPWKEGSRSFADPELDGKPYDEWKVEQLKAEVAKRNELRADSPEYADEEPMSTDGLKADFVKRLSEDDEADAPE